MCGDFKNASLDNDNCVTRTDANPEQFAAWGSVARGNKANHSTSTKADDEAFVLSKDIAKKIEDEMTYPGQVKVCVIRETRAVDYAR